MQPNLKKEENFSPRLISNQLLRSKIWGRIIGAYDCSDVIVQVITAKDPSCTRQPFIEVLAESIGKKYHIILMNKCDLVPAWVSKKWLNILRKESFTIGFSASLTRPVGKVALLSVLRKFSIVLKSKQLITVSFMGLPAVGKSSVVNVLRSKVVCESAAEPGTTKVCRLVSATARILLLDCPGFAFDPFNHEEIGVILNGMASNKVTKRASDYLQNLLKRLKNEHISRIHSLKLWSNTAEVVRRSSKQSGDLVKKGRCNMEPCAKKFLRGWRFRKNLFVNFPKGSHASE